jgi:cell division protein FtsN
MANNGGARSSSSGKNESLIIGILVGMVLGLAVAGGVAWYLAKKPNPYTNNVQAHEAKPGAETAKSAPAASQTAQPRPASQAGSSVEGNKQRFEFYKILTDKQEGEAHAPKEGSTPSARGSAYFLQAGSFATAEDADKLKAKIALIGMEASVQTANIPDKGVRYRVRLGPYHSADEMNKAIALLRQNGIADTATVHAQ